MKTRRPSKGWLLSIWLGPTLSLLLLSVILYQHHRVEATDAVPDAVGEAFVNCLRQGLHGVAEELRAPTLEAELGMSVVRIYRFGKTMHRSLLPAGSLQETCQRGHEELQGSHLLRSLSGEERTQLRLRVDIVTGRGTLLEGYEPLGSLGLHPGLDGFGARIGGRNYLLLPSELADRRLLSSNRPLPFVQDFVVGFARERALDVLKKWYALDEAAALHAEGRGDQARPNQPVADALVTETFRFRVASFVESELHAATLSGPVVRLQRDSFPGIEVSAASLREAALLGGRYLVAHLADSGRYIYLANAATGKQSDPERGPYSLPRHAGTTYFLAELYRYTGEDFLREPIERAIGHMAQLVLEAHCQGTSKAGRTFVCVADRGKSNTDLGSTALAVVALAEYQRATGSDRFEELMRKMTEFLLHMQRSDGSFAHVYKHKAGRIDHEKQLLYYSGESSLALARAYEVTGDKRYLNAAEAGLDWIVSWYDFFLGGFFYGEEHWTCIAAEAIYPAVQKDSYVDFCLGYADFVRDHQLQPGEYQEQDDWVGTYKVSPFLAPQNTPAGSRTEAMISTYVLAQNRGRKTPALWDQIQYALHYLLRQQIRGDALFRVPRGVGGEGAITGGPIDRDVRIDYVQHVCSAMIRASHILASADIDP